jgi:hypothetical protein
VPVVERHWRSAVTAIIVPMLEGAAVHTAAFAESLAADILPASASVD